LEFVAQAGQTTTTIGSSQGRCVFPFFFFFSFLGIAKKNKNLKVGL
jgi:hypothetical protein